MNMKKTAYKKILFLLSIVFIGSCNCNSDKPLKCNDYRYKDPIRLFEFCYEEVDTIKIRLYKKDQSFKNCIDSFYLFPTNVGSTEISASSTNGIPTGCDWKIEFNDTSIYEVKNILVGIEEHNSFLSSYSECSIISYNLNDTIITHSNIYISSHYRRLRR